MRTSLPVCFLILAVVAAAAEPALAVGNPSGLMHVEQDETEVVGFWRDLEARGDVVRLSKPRLVLELSNASDEPTRVWSRLRVVTDARVRALRLPVVHLAAGESRSLHVNLQPALPDRLVLRFSGKITLALEVSTPRGHGHAQRETAAAGYATDTQGDRRRPDNPEETVSVSLPAIYFHREGTDLVAYREDALREQYGAGNFRNEPLVVPEITAAIREDLARTGLGSIEPVLALVHTVDTDSRPGIPDDVLPPGSKKFCFGLDGSAFDDSSQPSASQFGPPTEDRGLVGEFVPASRGWVAVGQLGNPLFTGFLDPDGCIPFVITDSVNDISVAFFPLYLREPVDIRGFVSDLNLGPQWPNSMPWFLFFFPPGNALMTEVLLDEEEYVNTIFVAAANAMERARGGRSDVLYEFRLREAGDNAGTNAFYAAEGHPQVRIKYSVAAREKFVIAHEYGHASHIADLAPPLTTNDLDYSVTAGEAEQHTLTSKEWQLTAAFEGFAHYISGLVWNDAVPDEGALFASGGDEYLLDDFDRRFETNFDPTQFPDQGVELDWAQFFWNYDTDEFMAANGNEVLGPPLGAILDMWLASQPWPVNQGFFDDFRDGVEIILGTFGPANPVEEGLERLHGIAAAAGVDH